MGISVFIEFLGGKREYFFLFSKKISLESPLCGLWWGIMVLIILIFSGQSSKFIYIDF